MSQPNYKQQTMVLMQVQMNSLFMELFSLFILDVYAV